MLKAKVARVDGLPRFLEPLVVCNEKHRFVIAEELHRLGKRATVALEPFGRNTAPALTLAALRAACSDADPVSVFMAADHPIADGDSLRESVMRAARRSTEGMAVTFGITPDCPETSDGYIQQGSPQGDESGGYRLARFVEKARSRDCAALSRLGRISLQQQHFRYAGIDRACRAASLHAGHSRRMQGGACR